jgi:hypothetical protein
VDFDCNSTEKFPQKAKIARIVPEPPKRRLTAKLRVFAANLSILDFAEKVEDSENRENRS